MSVLGTVAAAATAFFTGGNPQLTMLAPAIGEPFFSVDVLEIEAQSIETKKEIDAEADR